MIQTGINRLIFFRRHKCGIIFFFYSLQDYVCLPKNDGNARNRRRTKKYTEIPNTLEYLRVAARRNAIFNLTDLKKWDEKYDYNPKENEKFVTKSLIYRDDSTFLSIWTLVMFIPRGHLHATVCFSPNNTVVNKNEARTSNRWNARENIPGE